MLTRRVAMTAAAFAPIAAISTAALAAETDPIFAAIARVDAAHARWEAADEPSPEWTAANEALGQAHDLALATTPVTLAGILALIAYARRWGFFDDDRTADGIAATIERSIAGMVDA